jgi:hypothetical protein
MAMERRRIDEMRILLRGGTVLVPWLSREALLERLGKVERWMTFATRSGPSGPPSPSV